jgi:hypothetical protein
MKRFWTGLLTLLTLSACAAPGPLRVLFVGNSHTYINDLPALVQQIGVAKAVVIEVDSVTAGGATLEDHIQSGEVRQRLESAAFSAVVLQEQSGHQVLEVNGYEASARTLAELARAHNARTFIYMGWTRQSAVEQYGYTQQNWTNNALRVARAIGAGVAPVGEAWLHAKRSDPVLGLQLQESDGNHATFAGSYAAAATIFYALTGVSPVGAATKQPFLPLLPEDASKLEQSALDANLALEPRFRQPLK